MVLDTRPRAGDGYSAIATGNFGRHDAVLARSDGPSPHAFAIYIRPQVAPRFQAALFKEGHALMMLGFAPRPRCKFFVVGCALAGGFELVLEDLGESDRESAARSLFDKLQEELEPLLDQIADQMTHGRKLGLPTRLPTPPPISV